VISKDWQQFNQQLMQADLVRLMLDYDGTLADFAPTPDVVPRDAPLISLLSRLAASGKYLLAVVSGRSLPHLREMLPIEGILLAGTYGLEMLLPDGTLRIHADYPAVRPLLDRVKPLWQNLILEEHGFFLEDKVWALALHGKIAAEADARRVLDAAQSVLKEMEPGPEYSIERSGRFLEICPVPANKRQSIELILRRYTPPGILPVFVGDDSHDEEAFQSVLAAGGYCIRVADGDVDSRAQFRLENPLQVRLWLAHLADQTINAKS
jgi:trehalose 6-phosphate phosphatase